MKPSLLKHFESLCVKEISDPKTTKPHILPIYATASYNFDSSQEGIEIFEGKKAGHSYSRYGNPTSEAVAAKIAALESFGMDSTAYGFLTSTGMSAVHTAVISLLSAGDKILTQGNLYGGSTALFQKIFSKLGIETIFTNLNDSDRIKNEFAEHPEIKLIYLETPTNPTLSCIDIKSISDIAKEYKCYTAIDNTFATPYLQRPFEHGIDVIIHSTTKYLNGHGNAVSGGVFCMNEEIRENIWNTLKLAGATANPFDSFLLHNGMKTLVLRMDKHCQNAMEIASYLENHNKVVKVNYPGLKSHETHDIAKKQMSQFGGMLSFELEGGIEAGIAFMDRLQHCTMAPTLGDVDTLVLHPASSSHLKVSKEMRLRNGITDGLIRISVGIESAADIIADIEQAIG